MVRKSSLDLLPAAGKAFLLATLVYNIARIRMRSGTGLKINYVMRLVYVIVLRSGWPSHIPDGNAKKFDSGDQTYFRVGNAVRLGTRLPAPPLIVAVLGWYRSCGQQTPAGGDGPIPSGIPRSPDQKLPWSRCRQGRKNGTSRGQSTFASFALPLQLQPLQHHWQHLEGTMARRCQGRSRPTPRACHSSMVPL